MIYQIASQIQNYYYLDTNMYVNTIESYIHMQGLQAMQGFIWWDWSTTAVSFIIGHTIIMCMASWLWKLIIANL